MFFIRSCSWNFCKINRKNCNANFAEFLRTVFYRTSPVAAFVGQKTSIVSLYQSLVRVSFDMCFRYFNITAFHPVKCWHIRSVVKCLANYNPGGTSQKTSFLSVVCWRCKCFNCYTYGRGTLQPFFFFLDLPESCNFIKKNWGLQLYQKRS